MPAHQYEGYKYANYPFAYLFKDDNGSKSDEKIHQILFGDWVGVLKPKTTDGDYVYVYVRGEKGWMHKNMLLDERVLEIVFVDVGQGDGALVVTPDDEHFIVDTGLGDNMLRYLNWRYNGFKTKWTFKYGIATHGDIDHYGGFHYLAGVENLSFENYIHNGLMEYRSGIKPTVFGESEVDNRTYYTELFDTKQKIETFLSHRPNWENPTKPWFQKQYAKLLKRMLDNDKIENEIQTLSSSDGFLKGYEEHKPLSIKVLGPVTETVNGKKALRSLGNSGKTKNGHSIILKLNYKDITIFMGGDLNSSAERYLLKSYTGNSLRFGNSNPEADFLDQARTIFQADIAKACHHGSADFTSLFLKCINTAATIISSGDEESYSHPNPATLGAVGVNSRGERPLIFSTELARSHREDERETVNEIKEIDLQLETETDPQKRMDLIDEKQEKIEKLKERNVTVYGSINVRTDGERCIIAQKLEKGGKGKRWDIHKLEKNEDGKFEYIL